MTHHRDTITERMDKIAEIIFASLDPEYYLAGGTALALQIGHRKSIDLDYFIAKNIDTADLRKKIGELFPSNTVEIAFEEKNTLWCSVDGVKVSFITRFDPLLVAVSPTDNFRLASIDDLTVMKLSAICGREEYKDYFDLACLAKNADARTWISLWVKAYPHIDPTSWIVALSAVESVVLIPLVIFPEYNNLDTCRVISSAVRDITKYIAAQSTSGAT